LNGKQKPQDHKEHGGKQESGKGIKRLEEEFTGGYEQRARLRHRQKRGVKKRKDVLKT